jgi:hypothetical protein
MSTISNLNSTNYNDITTKMNSILSSNQQPVINIFSDQAGTQYVNDSAGNPINQFQIYSISCTNSYFDSVNNAPVNSSVTITFINKTTLKIIDNVDTYWYTITGIDFPSRIF